MSINNSILKRIMLNWALLADSGRIYRGEMGIRDSVSGFRIKGLKADVGLKVQKN